MANVLLVKKLFKANQSKMESLPVNSTTYARMYDYRQDQELQNSTRDKDVVHFCTHLVR